MREDVAAQTHWPMHYRYGTIATTADMIKNRTEWLPHLIHECIHLLMADLHDYLDETSPPKFLDVLKRDLMETTVSTLGNINYEIFIDAHGETLDKYLR